MENKKITKIELAIILKEHQLWLNTRFSSKVEGKRANLTGANLIGADLRWADLREADLRWANLIGADLTGAKLIKANLRGANLTGAKLIKANLRGANLTGAKLIKANLRGANLTGADLTGADLTEAYLIKAENIRKGLILKESMIVFKSVKLSNNKNTIATLEIPTGAIVFSINNSKCRTNKAKVLQIDGLENGLEAYSQYNNRFKYEVGQEIEIENFNLMYNVECASGIHFFKTKKEAENY